MSNNPQNDPQVDPQADPLADPLADPTDPKLIPKLISGQKSCCTALYNTSINTVKIQGGQVVWALSETSSNSKCSYQTVVEPIPKIVPEMIQELIPKNPLIQMYI